MEKCLLSIRLRLVIHLTDDQLLELKEIMALQERMIDVNRNQIIMINHLQQQGVVSEHETLENKKDKYPLTIAKRQYALNISAAKIEYNDLIKQYEKRVVDYQLNIANQLSEVDTAIFSLQDGQAKELIQMQGNPIYAKHDGYVQDLQIDYSGDIMKSGVVMMNIVRVGAKFLCRLNCLQICL